MDSTALGIVLALLGAALFAAIAWYNETTGEIINPSPFRSGFLLREKHPRVFRSIQWFWKGGAVLCVLMAIAIALGVLPGR